MDGYYSGLNSCSYSGNNNDNYYTLKKEDNACESHQSSSNSKSQPNYNEDGVVGGILGCGARAALTSGIGDAAAGYSLGSKAFKDMCESNNNN
jgi:hypothetical protein